MNSDGVTIKLRWSKRKKNERMEINNDGAILIKDVRVCVKDWMERRQNNR